MCKVTHYSTIHNSKILEMYMPMIRDHAFNGVTQCLAT